MLNERALLPEHFIRKIARSVHEAARDVARRIAKTPQYVCSRHERKKVISTFLDSVFAQVSYSFGCDRSVQANMRQVHQQPSLPRVQKFVGIGGSVVMAMADPRFT
jgi:hypothetical protein